ncbi:uncharacterized protein PRCAT00003583001 [Priceomyces carsonii]|uniref:uncharacterized protein n=1 Tax=Priceomyces carsonii TaxID=28549 RepID=UPI002ED94E50|nr:unnamed protein product [Priceomyces carsonii]
MLKGHSNYKFTPSNSLSRKSHSLEFFILLTQNSIQKFEAVNEQIELSKSSSRIISLLVEHEYFLMLSKLNIKKVCKALFEQQMISFKRLMTFLQHSDIVNFPRNSSFLRRISKCIGIYLINFTSYYEMENYQVTFLKMFTNSVIEVFQKLPTLVDLWFECLENDAYIKNILKTKGFTLVKSKFFTYKCFPVYDLIRSFIFIDEDELQFNILTRLLDIKSNTLNVWLHDYSDICSIFIEKFTDSFNHSCLVKAEDDNFDKFLILYYNCLEFCCSNIKTTLLANFESQFVNEILNMKLNNVSIMYIFKILTLMIPFNLSKISLRLLQREQFENLLIHISNYLFEFRILLLGIIEKISESDEYLTIHLFGKEDKETTICINDLRTMLMKSSNCSFPEILPKICFESLKDANLITFNIFNDQMVYSRAILLCLLGFYHNEHEIDLVLVTIIISLQRKTNLTNNAKFRLIIEFLFEAQQTYREMFQQFEEEKYNTMTSFKERTYEVLRPTNNLLDKLNLGEPDQSSMVTYEDLQKKIDLFESLLMRVYATGKLKKIMSCKFESLARSKTELV